MVTPVLDLSQDYLVWENLEPVRIYPAPRLDATSVPVLRAKRRALSRRDLMDGNGAYLANDLVWIVPQLELSQAPIDFELHPGDLVHDEDEQEWTVLSAAWNKLKQTWRLVTRSLALNLNLRDSITILRPLIAYGTAAEPVFNWAQASAIVTAIPCRVQPDQTGVETHNEVTAAATTYKVILGQQVALQAYDRFSATLQATGEVILLEWQRHMNAERLDELPMVQCVRVG